MTLELFVILNDAVVDEGNLAGRVSMWVSVDVVRSTVRCPTRMTNRNTTFMTWNVLHLAKMLKDTGGIPAQGNQRSKWDAGARFDFENPEYR